MLLDYGMGECLSSGVLLDYGMGECLSSGVLLDCGMGNASLQECCLIMVWGNLKRVNFSYSSATNASLLGMLLDYGMGNASLQLIMVLGNASLQECCIGECLSSGVLYWGMPLFRSVQMLQGNSWSLLSQNYTTQL